MHNGGIVARRDIPVLPIAELRSAVIASVRRGGRIASLFAWPWEGDVHLIALIANASGSLSLATSPVSGAYPALTPDCPQAHGFEREIWEQTGVVPEGHPWLKPMRYTRGDIGLADFFRVEGPEVHEVAVGPVHAGVIEPGHFRFQCHGERVMHLEISLGYQHRGVERALVGGPHPRTIHHMETLAGDTTIGHAAAYAMVIESLAGLQPSTRADALRGIAFELERMANHAGDLGALAGDVGYLPTASYCGRLRGDFLNLTALVCGSRFGRGMVRPGGVGFDVDAARAARLADGIRVALGDVGDAVGLLWGSPSVMARFEGTGRLSPEACESLGLVGLAARACGIERDVRCDFPFGIYRFAHIPVSTWPTGDVLARAQVRWLEIQRSAAFVLDRLKTLPDETIRTPVGELAGDSLAISLVEGWRGEICHVAITDPRGRFAAYKIVDPSFHNWSGLAMALRDQEISDFPLCNKSFNLSYCGHDL
jgi:Ni,Fe-hydrogenase III large subunit